MYMFSLKALCAHSQCKVGQVCEPLYFMPGWSKSFFWRRPAQTVHFASYLFTKLLEFSYILGMSGVNRSFEVMLKHLNLVQNFVLGCSRCIFFCLKPFFFADFLLFFGSLSCCITQLKCTHLCRAPTSRET